MVGLNRAEGLADSFQADDGLGRIHRVLPAGRERGGELRFRIPGEENPGVLADLGDIGVNLGPTGGLGVDRRKMGLGYHLLDDLGRTAGIDQVVDQQPAGTVAFEWDGKNANGTQVPDGNYSFSVEASANGSKVSTTPIQLGTVSAVVRSGTSFVLELSSGETVAFDDVLQFM